ncbi:MAG TPA: BTAD domain-containing putative transcriptional regulator [Thermoanaerobaculia bacterium]|nr:BTAD domain-containing putative transcriptional regulator [Thermoanaerobaculia bacterium]
MSLPAPLTPLLGRARELEETERLLGSARLLTITGAGGSGKTRLALELAHRTASRFDDAVWVDLAPLTDPELIAQQVLTALGVRDLPAVDVPQVVVDTIRDRAILLVFDNCEHLVHAAAEVADVVLRGCPAAVILATSRETLGLIGEQTWLVPPLSDEDAVLLFETRARAALPSFTGHAGEVAAICRRLDGIPLAIELAAARVKSLSLAQIAERLDDAFRLLAAGSRTLPRHRTIRETIDWSYRLLSDDEQVLLRRLGAFGGSFTLEAAEAVCSDQQVDVLELLPSLVGKSLVLFETPRYRLLDTVRQFAVEKLEQSGERETLRERHARYFFELVARAEPKLFAGAVDPPTLASLDEELSNIRASLEWAEHDPNLELRFVTALHWYWFARGQFHEAHRRVSAALSRRTDAEALIRARAIVAAGNIAAWRGDWEAVLPLIDEAIVEFRRAHEPDALPMPLTLRGAALAFAENDHEAAQEAFAEAQSLARLDAPLTLAISLYWSGLAAQLRGDLAEARTAFEESLAIGERTASKPAIAHPLTVLGHLALHERKRDEALRHFRRALDLHRDADDRWGLTQAVEGIGLALLDTGDAETGTRLLAAASAAWMHLGARAARPSAFEKQKDERIREALDDQRLRIALASGAAMAYDQMVSLADDAIDRASGAPPLLVRALGPLEVERDGKPVDIGSPRDLLLFLLLHPNGATKEQIGVALWPDADPAKLRNNFHVTVHRLRKALGDADWVIARGESYVLKPGIDFDAVAFEREAKAAIRARDAARLSRAVELYHGDFFANASAGEWYLDVRDRLRDLYANALATLARLTGSVDTWQRLVELDPLDEEAARHLMTALTKEGDHAGASRVYRRLADALKRELDAEPEPETRSLLKRLTS